MSLIKPGGHELSHLFINKLFEILRQLTHELLTLPLPIEHETALLLYDDLDI